MFKLLFNGITSILANLLSVICWPINQVIETILPDFSDKLTFITDNLSSVFSGVTWAISILPPVVITTLIFILTLEVAKHTIFTSTHALIKVWNLIQKIKFW